MNLRERIGRLDSEGLSSRNIIFLESVTSTNDYARLISAERAEPHGTVIVADKQTHGRGRMGRQWLSPSGQNLYFTIIAVPDREIKDTQLVGLAAAVAAADAVTEISGLDARIKWPNDIIVNGRKAGGILTETSLRATRLFMFTGIGLNVNMPEDSMPQEIRPRATSLMIEGGLRTDRLQLLLAVLRRFDILYEMLLQGNTQSLIAEWMKKNCTIGRQVAVKTDNGVINGTAAGLTETGELIIKLPAGQKEYVRAGDVTILKKHGDGEAQ